MQRAPSSFVSKTHRLSENTSFVSYLPFDRTTSCVWLIEDDAESSEVAQAMIAAAVPVHEVEE